MNLHTITIIYLIAAFTIYIIGITLSKRFRNRIINIDEPHDWIFISFMWPFVATILFIMWLIGIIKSIFKKLF